MTVYKFELFVCVVNGLMAGINFMYWKEYHGGGSLLIGLACSAVCFDLARTLLKGEQ